MCPLSSFGLDSGCRVTTGWRCTGKASQKQWREAEHRACSKACAHGTLDLRTAREETKTHSVPLYRFQGTVCSAPGRLELENAWDWKPPRLTSQLVGEDPHEWPCQASPGPQHWGGPHRLTGHLAPLWGSYDHLGFAQVFVAGICFLLPLSLHPHPQLGGRLHCFPSFCRSRECIFFYKLITSCGGLKSRSRQWPRDPVLQRTGQRCVLSWWGREKTLLAPRPITPTPWLPSSVGVCSAMTPLALTVC